MPLEKNIGSAKSLKKYVAEDIAREELKRIHRESIELRVRSPLTNYDSNMSTINNRTPKRILDKLSPTEMKAHKKRVSELKKIERRTATLLRQGERVANKALKRRKK